jgi:hypothetical protein
MGYIVDCRLLAEPQGWVCCRCPVSATMFAPFGWAVQIDPLRNEQ